MCIFIIHSLFLSKYILYYPWTIVKRCLLLEAWRFRLFFFRIIFRIILNCIISRTNVGLTRVSLPHMVQQIMISHYATQGLEIVSYLVSLDRYPNYLHLCSSVYSHSQQWLIPDLTQLKILDPGLASNIFNLYIYRQ